MRVISTLITLALVGYGAFWLGEREPALKAKVLDLFHRHRLAALQPRFTSEQIVERQTKTDLNGRCLPPQLSLRPYLLMEVKFSNQSAQTQEGVILWDLVDGEMVTDTQSFAKTHGFADCMQMGAGTHEYEILMAISRCGGEASRDLLRKVLCVEETFLDFWLQKCQKKKLVVEREGTFRIHLQTPRLQVEPLTYIRQPLITHRTHVEEVSRSNYSISQVKQAAQAAFGDDFAVRLTQTILLPVYTVRVEEEGGTFYENQWNAINGRPILPSSPLATPCRQAASLPMDSVS